MNPLGLYDLDRNIRPVGAAYKQLIADWDQVLPAQSIVLQVPVVMPKESNESWAQAQKQDAKAASADKSTPEANAATNES